MTGDKRVHYILSRIKNLSLCVERCRIPHNSQTKEDRVQSSVALYEWAMQTLNPNIGHLSMPCSTTTLPRSPSLSTNHWQSLHTLRITACSSLVNQSGNTNVTLPPSVTRIDLVCNIYEHECDASHMSDNVVIATGLVHLSIRTTHPISFDSWVYRTFIHPNASQLERLEWKRVLKIGQSAGVYRMAPRPMLDFRDVSPRLHTVAFECFDHDTTFWLPPHVTSLTLKNGYTGSGISSKMPMLASHHSDVSELSIETEILVLSDLISILEACPSVQSLHLCAYRQVVADVELARGLSPYCHNLTQLSSDAFDLLLLYFGHQLFVGLEHIHPRLPIIGIGEYGSEIKAHHIPWLLDAFAKMTHPPLMNVWIDVTHPVPLAHVEYYKQLLSHPQTDMATLEFVDEEQEADTAPLLSRTDTHTYMLKSKNMVIKVPSVRVFIESNVNEQRLRDVLHMISGDNNAEIQKLVLHLAWDMNPFSAHSITFPLPVLSSTSRVLELHLNMSIINGAILSIIPNSVTDLRIKLQNTTLASGMDMATSGLVALVNHDLLWRIRQVHVEGRVITRPMGVDDAKHCHDSILFKPVFETLAEKRRTFPGTAMKFKFWDIYKDFTHAREWRLGNTCAISVAPLYNGEPATEDDVNSIVV